MAKPTFTAGTVLGLNNSGFFSIVTGFPDSIRTKYYELGALGFEFDAGVAADPENGVEAEEATLTIYKKRNGETLVHNASFSAIAKQVLNDVPVGFNDGLDLMGFINKNCQAPGASSGIPIATRA